MEEEEQMGTWAVLFLTHVLASVLMRWYDPFLGAHTQPRSVLSPMVKLGVSRWTLEYHRFKFEPFCSHKRGLQMDRTALLCVTVKLATRKMLAPMGDGRCVKGPPTDRHGLSKRYS